MQSEEYKKKLEEANKRLPRIGDRILFDRHWKSGSSEAPNPTEKGRIVGVTLTHFYVAPMGKPFLEVPHEAVTLDL